jgi:signal transduction histidine kinase
MTNFARLRSNELRYSLPAKWLLLFIGIWSLLQQPSLIFQLIVGAYGLATLAATVYFAGHWSEHGHSTAPFWVSQIVDIAFVTALIALGDGIANPLYLLYPLLALKSLVYATDVKGMVWLPFTFGPLYALALAVSYRGLVFLADPVFLARYLLLLILTVGIAGATLVLAGRLSEVDRLRVALAARTEDLAEQTRILQRTATDLGDRLLELRTLQEVAKALSATLYLNETLITIADRLSRLLGTSHCAVALLDQNERTISTLVTANGAPQPTLPLPVGDLQALSEMMTSGRSQVYTLPATGTHRGNGLHSLLAVWQAHSLEVTPLVTRGKPIGALLVGLDHAEPDSRHRSLSESLAYFAATAIENARLYGDAADKRRELEAVLAGIGDGVLVADIDGRLLLMNPVAARMAALETPLVGTPLRSLMPVDELVDLLEGTTTSGRMAIRDLAIPSAGLSADGQARTFQVLAAPVYRATETGEQVGGVVAVLRDITAQKELERMKSNFLSVVSHELKTPLHSIKGFVDIILMGKTGPVTELQRDFLSTVQEQTGHLQRLIEDLLEFSRLESGQIRLRPVLLQTDELVATVVDKLSPLASNKHLALSMDLPAGFPEIEADPMRLEQVLTNLVENAIKFTPEGGQVRVLGRDRAELIEIVVADTGIGVPVEERERIFDRFYQVDSSVRRRYKGTGLGLTICKHIVTQHGGRIWVEGAEREGSEFHVTLPKAFAQEQDTQPSLDFGALTQS